MMTGRHSKKSYHYKGLAVDGQVGAFKKDRVSTIDDRNVLMHNLIELLHKEDKSIYEQSIIARLSGFRGVGIYPHHKRNGRLYPSLHGDCRKVNLAWVGLSVKEVEKQIEEAKKKNETQIYIYLG